MKYSYVVAIACIYKMSNKNYINEKAKEFHLDFM